MTKKMAIPRAWSFLVRFVVPHVLMLMFALAVDGYVANDGSVWGDSALSLGYQLPGLIVAGAMVLVVFCGIVAPARFEKLLPVDTDRFPLFSTSSRKQGARDAASFKAVMNSDQPKSRTSWRTPGSTQPALSTQPGRRAT